MDDAAREHVRKPDSWHDMTGLADETRSIQQATRKLHAITRALIARVSAECDRGTITQDTVCALSELQGRYEDGRRAFERNSAALENSAGWLHLVRQARERGIEIGEQRAAALARASRARHRQDRPALRVLGLAVPPAAAGGWTALKAAARAHAKGTIASAATAGVLTAGTLTLTVANQPYSSAVPPQRVVMDLPAATAPASPATAPAPRRHHKTRKTAALPLPPLPSASPSPSPPTPPSPSPSSSLPPGTLTGPGTVYLAGGTVTFTLSASGGPVDWSASCSPGLAISPGSGHVASGLSVSVTVTAQDPGQGGTCWLQPGGTAVTVRPPS